MSGLAAGIESAGVATTSISLIREHSERLRPPRALWVPFPLGRPLGAADDAGFQKRVMRAAFSILDTATEPTIVDFPDEAPDTAGPAEWACPLNLPAPTVDETLVAPRLRSEVAFLQPWAAETRRRRDGRTLLGASGATVDEVMALVDLVGAVADGADPLSLPETANLTSVEWQFTMPYLLRHAVDDLRIVYHEAIASRPGPTPPDHYALSGWIMNETVFGEALTAVAAAITVDDARLEVLRGFIIPEGHLKGDVTFGRRKKDPVAAMQYFRDGGA